MRLTTLCHVEKDGRWLMMHRVKKNEDENASINVLYKEFLGEPNSHKAHELLHTTYVKRPKYTK